MDNLTEKEFKRLYMQARQEKITEEKRKFYQAKRERETSSSPMAEAADLKSAQCRFESDLEDKVDRIDP
jgi:hypothetical protein